MVEKKCNGTCKKDGACVCYRETLDDAIRGVVSAYVILQFQRQGIALKEQARQILIAKSLRAYRDAGNVDLPENKDDYLSHVHGILGTKIDKNGKEILGVVAAELTLMTMLRRGSDKIVHVCDRLDNGEVQMALEAYFIGMNVKLRKDELGFYVRVPASFDTQTMATTIRALGVKGKRVFILPKRERKDYKTRLVNGKWVE